MPPGSAWLACRGEESGDDAQSRHDEPALGSGARDRAAGGTASTIRLAPSQIFFRQFIAQENLP
jgi:hypothetical protein